MTWEIQIKELTLLDQFLEDLICIHTQDGVALAVNQVIQVMIINGRKYFTTNVAQKHVIIFKSYVIYNFQLSIVCKKLEICIADCCAFFIYL